MASGTTLDDYFGFDPTQSPISDFKSIHIVADGSLEFNKKTRLSRACSYCTKIFTNRGLKRHLSKCEVFRDFLDERRRNTGYRIRVYNWDLECGLCTTTNPVIYPRVEFFTSKIINQISNFDTSYFSKYKIDLERLSVMFEVNQVDGEIFCKKCNTITCSAKLEDVLCSKNTSWLNAHVVHEKILQKCEHDQIQFHCIVCLYSNFDLND